MAAVPPGYGDVSIKLGHAGQNRPAYITFGVDPTSTNPDIVALAIATAFKGAGSLAGKFSSSVVIGPTYVRLGQDGGEALVGVDDTTTVGVLGSATPPSNVAVLVHKRTARGGRRGRGRMFMPWWIGEADVDNTGNIINATITTLNTCLDVFRTALSSGSNPMVILHDEGKTVMGAPDVVTNMFVDRTVATQRRRLGR
jgi:hypothetical protein